MQLQFGFGDRPGKLHSTGGAVVLQTMHTPALPRGSISPQLPQTICSGMSQQENFHKKQYKPEETPNPRSGLASQQQKRC